VFDVRVKMAGSSVCSPWYLYANVQIPR